MASAFSMLFAKLAAIVSWFGDLAVSVFKAGWDMLSDIVCWGFDGLLGIAVTAMNALDLSGLNGAFGAWSQLPPDLLNVMGLMGVGAASAIVVAAIGVRLLLQLIPFPRLGS